MMRNAEIIQAVQVVKMYPMQNITSMQIFTASLKVDNITGKIFSDYNPADLHGMWHFECVILT